MATLADAPTHDSVKAQACRLMFPHMGFCYRCGFPWSVTDEHVTDYNINSGCFPLCEECWQILGSPEARIEYYKMLIDNWESAGSVIEEDTKRDIQKAVANGG